MGKKQKREEAAKNGDVSGSKSHRPKTKKKKTGRENSGNEDASLADETPTITIAVPGSIIDNAQSLELATRLAGQLSRAATIFRIDEIVVFDGKATAEVASTDVMETNSAANESGSSFLIRVLRYLETPQYLRKSLFPKHESLKCVGILPPIDAPHHLRKHEWASYREGITLDNVNQGSGGTLVDVGLSKNVTIDQVLEPGRRVTVEMGTNRNLDEVLKVVPSSRPREDGTFWGYSVRYAPNISSVFKNCPYQGGYDHRIGTSEHGLVINSSELDLPSFRHLLIAFGGLAGLEECVEEDGSLKGKNVRDLFDIYLNTCPRQGSRTIRTEEAVFISLQYFQEPIIRASAKFKRSTQ